MPFLTRDQILAASDRKFVEVDVPEWGGKVRVGEMTGAQRDNYELEAIASDEKSEGDQRSLRASLVARCAVDEAGKALFAKEDLVALGDKGWVALHRVFRAAATLNGLTKESREEAAKNSESGTPDAQRSA